MRNGWKPNRQKNLRALLFVQMSQGWFPGHVTLGDDTEGGLEGQGGRGTSMGMGVVVVAVLRALPPARRGWFLGHVTLGEDIEGGLGGQGGRGTSMEMAIVAVALRALPLARLAEGKEDQSANNRVGAVYLMARFEGLVVWT